MRFCQEHRTLVSTSTLGGQVRHHGPPGPKPHQVEGDGSIGVPPLKRECGDHDGNFQRMVDVSRKAFENALPNAKVIAFNPVDGTFCNSKSGRVFRSRGELASLVRGALKKRFGNDGGSERKGQAGWRTIARNAAFTSLVDVQGPPETEEEHWSGLARMWPGLQETRILAERTRRKRESSTL